MVVSVVCRTIRLFMYMLLSIHDMINKCHHYYQLLSSFRFGKKIVYISEDEKS